MPIVQSTVGSLNTLHLNAAAFHKKKRFAECAHFQVFAHFIGSLVYGAENVDGFLLPIDMRYYVLRFVMKLIQFLFSKPRFSVY